MSKKQFKDGEWYLINCANKVYVAGKYSEKDHGFWTYANGNPILHGPATKETYTLIEEKEEEKHPKITKRHK